MRSELVNIPLDSFLCVKNKRDSFAYSVPRSLASWYAVKVYGFQVNYSLQLSQPFPLNVYPVFYL